jgi:iron complex outermembrane receptor protein
MRSPLLYSLLISLFSSLSYGQSSSITGIFTDDLGAPIVYANISLLSSKDNSLVKVETTDENGVFNFQRIENGSYILLATYVGYEDFRKAIEVNDNADLGVLEFSSGSIELQTATVTARRSIVEVKADRMVFNVEGTINATGSNGMDLLRKAPGVLIDNNDNITVLGRSGVLVYVDGKRLPLQGVELVNYIRSLTAAQVDRIDIISNPGAKYEAEGNAGIIDIRLKRLKEVGANGQISAEGSKGRHYRSNLNGTGNYKNGNLNIFGSAGLGVNDYYNDIRFDNFQNNLLLRDTTNFFNEHQNYNYRLGTDLNIGDHSTFGFLVSGNVLDEDNMSRTTTYISPIANIEAIDSILLAGIDQITKRRNNTFNLNYVYQNQETSLNIDLDYGRFRNESAYEQPNQYVSPDRSEDFAQNDTRYDTPIDIDIYTAKLDYERPLGRGKLGLGGKFSQVLTKNSFQFYNIDNERIIFNDLRSNEFDYDESVYAAYGNYATPIGEKLNFSGGLRVEITDALGELRAFREDLQKPPVELYYVSFFPNVGLTYQQAPNKVWSLNYGRRINRPDYNVLNPFEIQISELSFMKGNESLNPEIVNNVELGYTFNYIYNFKVSYSRTSDQITRLIGPDESDERAGFISWDNIASQTVIGFNFSAPITVKEWWNMYLNVSASHIDNQADYGGGAVVDVQAFTYNLYQQQTFTLAKGFIGEISGYYSGPGVWGGVFEYDSNYSLNLGIQKKFLNNKLNVRIAASDITYQTGWSGFSEFNGLRGEGSGNWDSRRVSLNLSYSIASSKYKARRRSTGLESESKRVGG